MAEKRDNSGIKVNEAAFPGMGDAVFFCAAKNLILILNQCMKLRLINYTIDSLSEKETNTLSLDGYHMVKNRYCSLRNVI